MSVKYESYVVTLCDPSLGRTNPEAYIAIVVAVPITDIPEKGLLPIEYFTDRVEKINGFKVFFALPEVATVTVWSAIRSREPLTNYK